jgi:hypothetical protein
MKGAIVNQIDACWTHFFAFSIIFQTAGSAVIYAIILAIIRTAFHNTLSLLHFRFNERIQRSYAAEKGADGTEFVAKESPFS